MKMRPRVLVSNDDGVVAPGLRALAHELHLQDFCEFAVSGPMGERSAQSHCITIGKHLHAFNIEVEGASEAFAVVRSVPKICDQNKSNNIFINIILHINLCIYYYFYRMELQLIQ